MKCSISLVDGNQGCCQELKISLQGQEKGGGAQEVASPSGIFEEYSGGGWGKGGARSGEEGPKKSLKFRMPVDAF